MNDCVGVDFILQLVASLFGLRNILVYQLIDGACISAACVTNRQYRLQSFGAKENRDETLMI